jgi:hypothetical protein
LRDARNYALLVPDGYEPDTVRGLEQLAASTDISHPEETESAMLELISKGKGWPAHIQPLPLLHSNLAVSYRAKRNYCKEVHYLLHICFVSDLVLYTSCQDPAHVRNQFMLTMALHMLVKENHSAVPLQSFELGMVYKY